MAKTWLQKYSTYEEENPGSSNVTAAAAGTQAGATVFSTKWINVNVAAGANYSVAPNFAAQVGRKFYLENTTAQNVRLFPVNGGTDKFESQAANTHFDVGPGEYWEFRCVVAGTWRIK